MAQKLVDAKVAGVVGHLNSGTSIPASPIYNQAGIPVISGSATNPKLTDAKLGGIFRTISRDDVQGKVAADFATARAFKKIAILHDKTQYGQGLAEEFRNLPVLVVDDLPSARLALGTMLETMSCKVTRSSISSR